MIGWNDIRRIVPLSVCLAACAAADLGAAEEPAIRKRTFVYKQVGELAIKADVHRADDRAVRPVVVWIHGGALINGHRKGIDRRVRRILLEAGYVLVSIDYRLAPETKLPEIIEDLEDAFAWVHREGPNLFQGDTRRVAVMGGSAGGYLTLTAGYRARPRPAALVAFWGYGDLIGDWYSKPSPHPRHHRSKLTRSEAWREVSGPPIADSRNRKGSGGAFYEYCRQTGSWPKSVSGWDPHTQAEAFFPFMPLRNVDAQYPPTLLIHGTHDTDVPYEQSELMARELKRNRVVHELVTIQGGEHGLAGGDPERIEKAYDTALEFVNRYLRRDGSP